MCANERITSIDAPIIENFHCPKVLNVKSTFATACFVVGTLLAPLATHAADLDLDRTHPKTFVKDSVITTKIKASLATQKLSSLAHIRVDTTSKGAVVLSGRVRTQEEADKAVSIARETEGVTSVKSKLRIKQGD